jgi:hypothetical protein
MRLANNIAAFVNVLGVEYPGTVFELANFPWESDADRDKFIYEIATLGQGGQQ